MTELIKIVLDTENLYITSDLHLNHRNVIKYCNRPFEYSEAGVEKMNNVLINNLMQLPKGCTLLSLGDWALLHGSNKNRTLVHSVIERLLEKNINIYTVLGNHDRIFQKFENGNGSFINASELDKVYLQESADGSVKSVWYSGLSKILLNEKYYLTHEPFYLSEDDKMQLHGHIHNNPLHRENEWKSNVNTKFLQNYINCCADVHDFKPVLFSKLVAER